jgi:gas vesicle protein
MKRSPDSFRWEAGALIAGLLLGAVIAGAITLLVAPESGAALRKRLKARVDPNSARPVNDPAADRIAEGKAAARRLKAELGLN